MIARPSPAQTPLKLTQENHPENAPREAAEKQPTITLASAVGIGALSSLIGMTIGAAALSTSFQSSSRWEAISLLPLVGTAACILGGWIGAFFHMIRSDMSKAER
ncbi:MAG TPA: hypothetical protein VKU80_11950 [Planctomycetota bacterium]|nr:hypothetical protein [Planctomycetota bacterium]